MSTRAQVHSTEAIEAFRSKLVVYLSNIRKCLASATEEVRSVRGWIESDRQLYWLGELKRRNKQLQQCKDDFNATPTMGNEGASRSVRRMALERAKHAVDDAEEKLKKIRRYRQEFEKMVGGHLKHLETVGQNVTGNLQEGIHFLANIEKALDAYKNLQVTGADSPGALPATSPESETPPPGAQP
jgi:hypothetical protein